MANKTSEKLAKVAKKPAASQVAAKPTLLAGGNPQIAKAYGDAPIRMSQDLLAQSAGTVRQTANRVLRLGAREGVLGVERGIRRRRDARHPDSDTVDSTAGIEDQRGRDTDGGEMEVR